MSARFNPPDDDHLGAIPIVRTPQNKDLKVVLCSKKIVWVPTHYNGKSTTICDDSNSCELCKSQVRTWKGFAVVREFTGIRNALLCVTPNVKCAFEKELESSGDLTGLVCRFYRLGRKSNSPLFVQILGRNPIEEGLDPLTTVRHIERIFRCHIDTFLLAKNPPGSEPMPEVRIKRVP